MSLLIQKMKTVLAQHRYKKAFVQGQNTWTFSEIFSEATALSQELNKKDSPIACVVATSNKQLLIALLSLSQVNRTLYITQSEAKAKTPFLDLNHWQNSSNNQGTDAINSFPESLLLLDEVAFELAISELFENIEILNHQLNVKESDCILLQSDLPLKLKVTAMTWALINGKTIIDHTRTEREMVWDLIPNQENFSMNFSLFFFGAYSGKAATGSIYDLLLEVAKYGDENDYSAIWTPERHFNEFGGAYPNPSVLSAALAVQTKAMQVRCGSIVSPLHHSVRIAEDWSVLDNLSNGRVGVSFASGWQCNDFIFSPDRYGERHRIMLEQIGEVRQLWQGESMSLKNGLGAEIDIQIFPKPIQANLPIWITVSGKVETFIDAGRLGANILTHLLWQNTQELKDKIAAYRQSLADHGFDPASRTVSVMVHTFMGEDDAVVKEQVRQPLKDYIGSSVHLIETMVKSVQSEGNAESIGRYGKIDKDIDEQLLEELKEIAFERFFTSAALLGSPEKCRETIELLRSYDVDELACLLDFGLEKEVILEGLTHLTEFKKSYNQDLIQRYNVAVVFADEQQLEELKIPDEQRSSLASLKWVTSRKEQKSTQEINVDHLSGQVYGSNFEGNKLLLEIKKDGYKNMLASINQEIDEDY